MKNKIAKSSIALALLVSGVINANSSLIIPPSSVFKSPSLVILVESASKASAIVDVIKSGSNECAGVVLEERTDCVADVLKDTRKEIVRQDFATKKLRRIFRGAEKQMRKLPDDGSAESFLKGEQIIDGLSADIKTFANTRPLNFQRHNLAIAIAVPSLKKPLNGRKT